ncbi:MAG TPA: hypothetical protein VN325_17335 [Steroidobacteraceae bacterium]|nr:hypothetical protein [Steroidobacteraceae bacterium]
MKNAAAALALILSGCGTVQLVRAPEVSEPTCTATCNAHYDQCPQVFANFPERGAVECPAEHNQCLKACKSAPPAAPAPVPHAPVAASVASAGVSREARLRELKHFYEEGLVTEDVYRERQTAILGEP